MSVLPPDFYDRPVLAVAPELIGCRVEFGDGCGVIVETEAYHESEPACHAFAGLTPRTEVLFGPPGVAYVYRSYGVHSLLNAVCEPEGVGAAVLIRALAPLRGIEAMRVRRQGRMSGSQRARPLRDVDLCSGPGKLTQALGLGLGENGGDLSRGAIRIHARSGPWREPSVVRGPRIGITRAVELPWRFCAAGDANVSRPRPSSADWSGARGARVERMRPAGPPLVRGVGGS